MCGVTNKEEKYMNINCICIGNYVRINGNKDPIKIDAIHLRKMGWHERKDRLSWAFLGNIEPIPLDDNFFEKVGMHKFKDGCFDYCDDFYTLTVDEINDGTWLIRYYSHEFSNTPKEQLLVSYIHEFQNFLNHCGIKEINVEL